MYSYDATVVRVVDGDTVRLKLSKIFTQQIDFGFHITENMSTSKSVEMNFRLLGVDTPEVRGKERPAGLKVKAALEEKNSRKETESCHPQPRS